MKSNSPFVRYPGIGYLSHAFLVTVTSESCVNRVICKTLTGTFANNADLDQRAMSNHGLYCLLKLLLITV